MSSIPENVDDRLIMLPEDILSHVLSLMPTRFAVRTSILSKRWRYAWTSVTNLEFDDSRSCPPYYVTGDGDEEKFTQFVDRVFSFRKTPHVKSFRLQNSHLRVPCSTISNWVDTAVGLNVHELDIIVLWDCELPLSMLTCNTLTSLRLALDTDDWKFPSRIYLPSLKTLDLFGSLSTAFRLISGCPVLENLYLTLFGLLEEDCVFNIPILKRLKLIFQSASSSVSNKVFLRLPQLEYLCVGGVLGSLFVMEGVSSLVEGSILGRAWSIASDYLWADLLNKISVVQILSISLRDFSFTSPLPVFPNLKQLELNGRWNSGHITHFLKSCPELKYLSIDFVDWSVFESEESSWIEFEPEVIPACMLAKLTTIKFLECKGEESDIAFLEYMLGNSSVLKAVTVYVWENLLISEDPWIYARVLRIPRASQRCEIYFQPRKLPPWLRLELGKTNATTLMKQLQHCRGRPTKQEYCNSSC